MYRKLETASLTIFSGSIPLNVDNALSQGFSWYYSVVQ